jgi:hypothetical protein
MDRETYTHPQTINITECSSIWSAPFEEFLNPFHIRVIKKGGDVYNYLAGIKKQCRAISKDHRFYQVAPDSSTML